VRADLPGAVLLYTGLQGCWLTSRLERTHSHAPDTTAHQGTSERPARVPFFWGVIGCLLWILGLYTNFPGGPAPAHPGGAPHCPELGDG